MNARDHARLTKKIEAHLIAIGAVRTPGKSYDFALNTPLGELGITVNETHYTALVTIFCRFDKPVLAVKRFPNEVNPFSGKWNTHYGSGWTVASVYACFVADLEKTRDARAIALSVAQWSTP